MLILISSVHFNPLFSFSVCVLFLRSPTAISSSSLMFYFGFLILCSSYPVQFLFSMLNFHLKKFLLRVLKFIFQYFSSTGLCFFSCILDYMDYIYSSYIKCLVTHYIISVISMSICIDDLSPGDGAYISVSSYAGNVLLDGHYDFALLDAEFSPVCSMVLSFVQESQ